MALRLNNPQIPYSGPLSLKVGTTIYFKGTVHRKTPRFHINLQAGSNTAFHFNPRFPEKPFVVCNTAKSRKWEKEERHVTMPFALGKGFEARMIVKSDCYEVMVNGQHFCQYKHRMAVSSVTGLLIAGGVSMETVIIDGEEQQEEKKSPPQTKPVEPKIPPSKIEPPAVMVIYGGLRAGMYLDIRGTVPQDCKGFGINLMCGSGKDCDNALSVNAMLDSKAVMLNSFLAGQWGEEERHGKMPFTLGGSFQMLIFINSEGYQLVVNKEAFHVFKHRTYVEGVSAIKIVGNVVVEILNIIEGIEVNMPVYLHQARILVPKAPYTAPIYSGLKPGMFMYFRGTVNRGKIKGFQINLKGEHVQALHLNAVLTCHPCVMFNTMRRRRWQREEKVPSMPFCKGQDFQILFYTAPKGFRVYINGRPFYMYKYRAPLEHAKLVEVVGDVTMHSIDIVGGGKGGVNAWRGLRTMEIEKIPYAESIYGGLGPGMYLYFRGAIPNDINSFAIRLQYSELKGSDIAFQFRTVFEPREMVAANCLQAGKWGKPDKIQKMPFRKGEAFELLFILTAQGFQVIVNGRPFQLFKYRLPVFAVSAIKVVGDVTMETVKIIRGVKGALEAHPGLRKMVITKIPHVGPVYGGLRPGMALHFKGTVPENSKSFQISLQYGQLKGSDKAFFFNPQFEPSEGVVVNSFRNDGWEKTGRIDRMPFLRGRSFDLVFIVTQHDYQVNVNGRWFHAFTHRMPVEFVSAVEIDGDVSVQTVDITEAGKVSLLRRLGLGKVAISSIPFVGSVQGCLKTGMYLYFRGAVPQESNGFSISLQSAEQDGSDAALWFSPQFSDGGGVVVFASVKDSQSQREEKIRQFPFQKGQAFEIVFIITLKGYQVLVNGRVLHLFLHRTPVEQVSAVKIAGVVTMSTLHLIRGGRGIGGPGRMTVSKIPHVGPVYGGLRTGMFVLFRGTIPQETKSFAISLQCGELDGGDKALYFHPQFSSGGGVVVFGSFKNGQWQPEEKIHQMPFTPGQDFLLVFIITHKGFQVTVNGRLLHFFEHRMPVEYVSAVTIDGDVSVLTVDTTGGEEEEDDEEETPSIGKTGKLVFTKIPHLAPIHRGLRPGTSLRFNGEIPEKIDSFTISLQYGDAEGSDTAFHFQPQFSPCEMVLFNSFHKGKWDKEEKVYKMPFTKGGDFELLIIITLRGYQVLVDGEKFHFFSHRIPVEPVNAIKISGDVSMETLNRTDGEPEEPEEEVARSIPYMGPFYGGLRTGMSIYFKGKVPENIDRFSIDLLCGETDGCDNALSLSPRFDSNEVVFRCFRSGSWEQDEKSEKMPFARGEDFVLLIIVTSKGYQVNVNDAEFYLFEHRIPVERVTGVKPSAEVKVHTFKILSGGQAGMMGRVIWGTMVVSKIPHVAPIQGGLRPGMYLYFKGRTDDDFSSFTVALQCGTKDVCDKALHFKPQLEPSEAVVLRSYSDGSWQNEERVDAMPFSKGQNFELLFIVTAKGYQVIINGRRFYMFKHRVGLEQVSTLSVDGDVTMETINMIGGGPGSIEGYRGLRNILIPKIPHVAPIYGGLKAWTYLYFRGTVPKDLKRFEIRLQCGEMKLSDIALNFKAQFAPKELVELSSFRNGKWETPEVVQELPFIRGQAFEVVFIVTVFSYQVVVNGRQFHIFKHRVPLENVVALGIEGPVSMSTVNMIKGGEGGRHPGLGKIAVPKIPHVGPVYGGLMPGMFLYFKGTVPQDMKSFTIDLPYSQMEGSDIAIRFQPQFEPSPAVLFNSFQKGEWGVEEKVEVMPFIPGQNFELVYIITFQGYQVNVNGRQFYLFKHRMVMQNVSAVRITGDVSVQTVDLSEGGQDSPDREPDGGEMKIPHVGPVCGGLRTGMYLYFKGTVPQEMKLFTISLMYGQLEGCDTAFHFQPQFEPSPAVLFNSCKNGEWGTEEKIDAMPFVKGQDYELHIFVTSKGYQVFINGRPFHLFSHRMPVEQVSALKVAGDITVPTFNVIRGGPGSIQAQPRLGKVVFTKIPHVEPVFGALRPGMYLYFQGLIPHSIESFHINLQYGRMEGCDKALCFCPQFTPSAAVLFNSVRNGDLEKEERVDLMPFHKGAPFELLFIITAEGYQVLVNGRQFYLFQHRMPVEQVTAVSVGGDVSMQTLYTVTRGSTGHPDQPGVGQMVISKIPHVGPIFGGLRKGMALYFRGTVPVSVNQECANRFSIDLQCGQVDGSDKAFKLSAQLQPTPAVLLNSFRNGRWEREEKVDMMPFEPGRSFELLIIVTAKGYQVKVNGRLFYTFLHRMPVEYVSAVKIAGDVSLETGEITEGVEPEPEPVIPRIPMFQLMPGGLRDGMTVHFDGLIPKTFKSFNIDLNCGEDKSSDVALRFNAQMEKSEVVFSTIRNGVEEAPETVKTMPFEAGEDFDLVFVVTPLGYQVNVNDQKFYLYKHHITVENVTTFKFDGDIIIQSTNITEGGRFSQGTMVMESNPFVGPIPCGLRPGTYLYFRGKIDDDANRFNINLMCGEKQGCENAIQFRPQFQPTQGVLFNSFQDGQWGTEEKVDVMPFTKGQSFEVVFIVTSAGYQVILNGRRFYLFKHRVPAERVCAVKIGGDITIDPIKIIGAPVPGCQGLRKMVVTRIPYVGPMYGGLRPGMYLYFWGKVPDELESFAINLQSGEVKDSDIAFQFKPQFQPKEVVLLNSSRNGNWQKEEVVETMPFSKGKAFEVVFIVTAEGYLVLVNGRRFYVFKHRMPAEHVGAVNITGNVTMETVNTFGGGEGGMLPGLGKIAVPKIPHVGPVYGGLRTGMFVLFHGTVPEAMKSFAINLQYGQLEGSDIAFSFLPRFEPSPGVLFNAFRNGSWEEAETVNMMPFTPGQGFELVFMITPEGYQVYFNGRHFYLFKHRMAVEQVCAINLTGDISIQNLEMTERGKGAPELPAPGPVVVSTTPHVEPISGGMRPGMYLYFKGTIPQVCKSFAINLQNGGMEGCDVALCLRPQFEPSEGAVLSSFLNGQWGKEEKPAVMPFQRGGVFELVIIVTTEGYQVNVNGRQLHFFTHRVPVEQVSAVNIIGDVSLDNVNMVKRGPSQPGLGEVQISKIPHVAPTYGGLRPGMYLYFWGTIPQEIKSFAVDLQYADMEGSDIAYRFQPQFEPSPAVLFNSCKDGAWATEEKVDVMPFTKGQSFEMVFIITSMGYQVIVNGRQFYLFKHRMPVEQVSAIKMTGDVSMKTLNMIEGGQGVEAFPDGKMEIAEIPHVGPVYGGLRPGMALFFQGTIPDEIESYTISLQYGVAKEADIAFQFVGRVEPDDEVLCNSRSNGVWGEEERVDDMPFEPGEEFELVFIVTKEGFQVIADGQRYHFFRHRLPVEQIGALAVSGDIRLQPVRMIKGEDVEIKEKPAEPEVIQEVEPVPGVLRVGMALYFQGTIPTDLTSFTVNLRCAQSKDSDIGFSFNPQLGDTDLVVFNSCQGGSWGAEDTVRAMPFQEGQSFQLVFLATEKGYQVYVNRRLFHFFAHRLPLEKVNTVEFVGITMQAVNLIEEKDVQKEDEADDDTAISTVQTESPLPSGLKPEMSLTLRGTIPADITRFCVDLVCGDADGCDTALRFCPSFAPAGLLLFNSFHNGQWGEEETVAMTPFQKGQDFFLVIQVTTVGYKVLVNGVEVYVFKHRLAMGSVRAVKVLGNLTVEKVDISEGKPEPVDKPDQEVPETVQYETPVPGGLKTGTTVNFQGTIPEDTKRFSIVLPCGEKEGSDIAFLFSPRFETSEVVSNSFHKGSWGVEEKVEKMPFTKGGKLDLSFLITTDGYQVTVNGAEFYLFKHRISAENVRALRVTGDVSVPTVNIVKGAKEYPSPADLGTVQSETPVTGSLKREMTLTFLGVLPADIQRFSVNLLCGTTPDSDIAFHFSPQFDTSQVLLNAYRKGCWETPEKVDQMPFTKGEKFELVYIITPDGYRVSVNGAEFYLFKHRMLVENVRALRVLGDVLIKVVNVEEPVLKYPSPSQLGPVQSVTPVTGTLKTGMSMFFKGTIPNDVERFCINLQCGDTEACDTALHVNLLFDTSEALFNTFRKGCWEEAEKVAGMPFIKGQGFLLVFLITAEGYQVNVNGTGFYLYKHRIALEQVRSIQVIGNVTWETVNVVQGTVTEYPRPAQLGPVQSTAPVQGNLKPGMSVSFEGSIPADITGFCINLQCGETEDSDIAFHFSPQFETSEVLFDSFRKGKWERQEKVGEMPFRKGESFLLLFNITTDGYKVLVNGDELYMFKHRISLGNVAALQIIGNVAMTKVNIMEMMLTAPSVTTLPGGLKPGTSVIFQGVMPIESSQFSIDLLCGTAENSDIAFHFSPQAEPSEALIFNALEKGSWGLEEKVNRLPFARGDEFDITLLITDKDCLVTIDGEEIHRFPQRISFQSVKALRISGNVNMPVVNIVEGGMSCVGPPTMVMSAPQVIPISGSLKEGTSIRFKMIIPKETPSFSIDLLCGAGVGCDKAMHFGCEFQPSQAAVFNSFQGGGWGQEERAAVMPFQQGALCELVFNITSEGYQAMVNGAEFHTFPHRVLLDQVTSLQVLGNVDLHGVRIIEGATFHQGPMMLSGFGQRPVRARPGLLF